ncbi:cob(I)yrinic acid a,c-diamide adenosyltransferase [Massilibacterium senegalense]|uniref:cob(I)yrinic acid a,c-diamide adenosyltransferase n=1 Tax=Massilibacterium senegalense TaxID=1632858 RepID=UPI0007836A1A|nr:cob(I)yrinic acid a,c-diamide adenosyltransferase [Massilibacterium senegalense]
MKLYTRTGDKGTTAVIGARVEKDDLRVEAYGTVDECNAFVGQAMAELKDHEALFNDILEELETVQHELFDCGGDLANFSEKRPFKLKQENIEQLEEKIDAHLQQAKPLERFILPGGSKPGSTLHICRTIARRAERRIVSLQKEQKIHPLTLSYMNRVSDYFFIVSRIVNARLHVNDVEYVRSAKVFNRGRRIESNEE